MGRILDLIKRRASQAPTIGFRAAPPPQGLPLVLIARVSEAGGMGDAADALLLERPPAEPPPGEMPWGVVVGAGSATDLSAFKEQGGSFVLIETGAPAELLGVKDLEYFVLVGPEVEEALARTLNLLPVDGFAVSLPSSPFKIEDLLLCGRLLALAGKPALAAVAPTASPQEVRILAEMGFKGLIIRGGPEQLREWKARLASLSPLRKGEEVTLPHIEGPEEEGASRRVPYTEATSCTPGPAPAG